MPCNSQMEPQEMTEEDQAQQQKADLASEPPVEAATSTQDGNEDLTSELSKVAQTEAAQPLPRLKSARQRQYRNEDEQQYTRLRLLCPLNMAGGLIGKKGESIMKIRQETGAQVAVEDYVVGSEDRVVAITAERSPAGDDVHSGEDALCSVFDRMCTLASSSKRRQPSGKASLDSGSSSTDTPSPLQSAPDSNGHVSETGDSEVSYGTTLSSTSTACSVRLLVDSSQIGYLVGKGGSTIRATTADTGASIQILSKSDLPPCACVTDEVVQIRGTQEQVKAALRVLGAQQRQHPPRHHFQGPAGPMLLGHAAHPDFSMYHSTLGGYPGGHGALPSHAAAVHHAVPAAFPMAMLHPVEVTFRLLAPVMKTGNIIGRSGEHVKRIRAETGARVKVFDPVGASEERLVIITSLEDALSPYCAAQDALIRCVISLTSDDPPGAPHRVRLLTSQASVGVVLGKKGQTVTQLRAETGAVIKVLAAEGVQVEGDAPEEVVQVEGNIQQCISALRGVATLLRCWQMRWQARQQPPRGSGGGPAISGPPSGMALPSSPLVPHPVSLSAHHLPAGMPPPPPPTSAGARKPAYPYAATPGALSPSGRHPLVAAPHQTLSYSLNQLQVGAVIGRGGNHITQVRQMSGARVLLPTDLNDAGERKLEISGTPEQCSAAHHLINSYLAMGRAPPANPV